MIDYETYCRIQSFARELILPGKMVVITQGAQPMTYVGRHRFHPG